MMVPGMTRVVPAGMLTVDPAGDTPVVPAGVLPAAPAGETPVVPATEVKTAAALMHVAAPPVSAVVLATCVPRDPDPQCELHSMACRIKSQENGPSHSERVRGLVR